MTHGRPLARLLGMAALATALLLTACTADPAPLPAPVPSSSSPRTGVDHTAEAIGDGTYLNGYAYLRGVNVYTLQFEVGSADEGDPGEPQSSYDYLASRGLKIVRLAVPWRDLQPVPANGDVQAGLAAPVSASYLATLQAEVTKIARAGMRTILDLHNGCTYPWGPGAFVEGSVRCGDGIAVDQASAVWIALSNTFRGDLRVAAYDIFNEPRFSVGIDVYKQFSQAVVDALRANGDTHPLWVEAVLGVRGRLAAMAPDGPWITDPLNKTMYSEHFYADESGATFDPAADYSDVYTAVTAFGTWCATYAVHCAVGEVGWPSGGTGGSQSAASAAGWNTVFEKFYALADQFDLDVTYFAASSTPTPGTLLAYGTSSSGIPAPGINSAFSQAEVIEKHPSVHQQAGANTALTKAAD